jgi:hypothetical protein
VERAKIPWCDCKRESIEGTNLQLFPDDERFLLLIEVNIFFMNEKLPPPPFKTGQKIAAKRTSDFWKKDQVFEVLEIIPAECACGPAIDSWKIHIGHTNSLYGLARARCKGCGKCYPLSIHDKLYFSPSSFYPIQEMPANISAELATSAITEERLDVPVPKRELTEVL